ncbi:uncharacterized protein AB675_10405 [Cyphellophora attinorum]|uniref:Peripheral subunit-binding (PSBD) domain-containing protein n=1 Tax=Cyphellophora attinorum TaxID=1664694 RepID=A0A0N1H488_9EURO|nr:uncharacterized protein AB675_10405 [Phialophora attinorum]KPI35947.1 hypothetical protein AB675_10405 [Phialophora attinorum]
MGSSNNSPVDAKPTIPASGIEDITHGAGQSSENDVVSEPVNERTHRRTLNSAPIMPTLRHLLKQNHIEAADVTGTGKNGRITKEDVDRILQLRVSSQAESTDNQPIQRTSTPSTAVKASPQKENDDVASTISRGGLAMFRSMTQALTIPHFMYSHEVDLTVLNDVRSSCKASAAASAPSTTLSPLPFVIKALSQAFLIDRRINAHLDTSVSPPQVIIRSRHNFGIAVDSPHGLVVPVIKDVQSLSVATIASEVKRLGLLAREGRLVPENLEGATFTVSNIGSIGGNVVAPIIVPPMVAIVAIGRARHVPVFQTDATGVEHIVKRDQLCMTWSADHRVLDGATIARVAEHTRLLVENVDTWSVALN